MKYLLFTITLLFGGLIQSQSPEISLNGTVSAENNQIKNVADPTDPGDALNKAYLEQVFQSLESQIEDLESQAEDLQGQIDQLNGYTPVVIIGLATAGGNSSSRLYFESNSSLDGEDSFNFSYGSTGWQGSGGNTLTEQGLNPNYIISQILAMVPNDGSVVLPSEFNTYFSIGDTFSFSGMENILTVDDYIITNFNTTINFDVRTNDADFEGEELVVSLLQGPISGTLILNDDSTFSFAPAVDFSGEVQFTYEVTDGENVVDATATIKVRDENFD